MAQTTPFEFTLQFAPGFGRVDAAAGVLYGVTVAEVGIASGHFAYVDKANRVVGVGGAGDASQFPTAARRLQLAMDEQSLLSVVAAAKATKRVKTREDHDDSVGSRAGFAENFRLDGAKVICDQTIFPNYANRGVFFDTAAETPELIGLSGDFKFTAEVKGEQAMMRVTKIDAVDIVDKGALTHAGLFSVKTAAAPSVDTPESEILAIMAKSAPTPPDLKAFKAMCDEIASYRAAHAENTASIDECMAALLPPKLVGNASPVVAPQSAMTASEKTELKTELTAELSAVFATKLSEATTAITNAAKAEALEFRKQMSALGMKASAGAQPTAEEIAAAKKTSDDEAAARAAAAGAKDATAKFFELKASIAKDRKVTPAQATSLIIAEQPQVWDAYQAKLGVCKTKAA